MRLGYIAPSTIISSLLILSLWLCMSFLVSKAVILLMKMIAIILVCQPGIACSIEGTSDADLQACITWCAPQPRVVKHHGRWPCVQCYQHDYKCITMAMSECYPICAVYVGRSPVCSVMMACLFGKDSGHCQGNGRSCDLKSLLDKRPCWCFAAAFQPSETYRG